MNENNDPIGEAIITYSKSGKSEDIFVQSNLCEDDIIPSSHFFRTYNKMPEIERIALEKCEGKILDIGAGAGCHTKWLISKNKDVLAIEISPEAITYLESQKIPCQKVDILNLKNKKFDTILILMNGLGLAGKLSKLVPFLKKIKTLLNKDGKILCDSTDISYLHEQEDGSILINLNAPYYGEMKFKMKYKEQETEWFDWLYVDIETLKDCADEAGLSCEIVFEDQNNSYLAELLHND